MKKEKIKFFMKILAAMIIAPIYFSDYILDILDILMM